MPYIEIDGKKKVGQSMACARYIAREHGKSSCSPLSTRSTPQECYSQRVLSPAHRLVVQEPNSG